MFKKYRKLTAIVLSLALVLTGITLVPNKTGAAEITLDQQMPGTNSDNNYTLGGYNVYVGGWNGSNAVGGVDADNSDHVIVQQTSSNWYNDGQWALQVQKTVDRLTANTTYDVSWKIKATKKDGKIQANFNQDGQVELTAGEHTITGTVTANASGVATFIIGMGYIGTTN